MNRRQKFGYVAIRRGIEDGGAEFFKLEDIREDEPRAYSTAEPDRVNPIVRIARILVTVEEVR